MRIAPFLIFFGRFNFKNNLNAQYIGNSLGKANEIYIDSNIVNVDNFILNGRTYIDIYDYLDKNSYYNTDTHWKQERLNKVVEKISTEMNYLIFC